MSENNRPLRPIRNKISDLFVSTFCPNRILTFGPKEKKAHDSTPPKRYKLSTDAKNFIHEQSAAYQIFVGLNMDTADSDEKLSQLMERLELKDRTKGLEVRTFFEKKNPFWSSKDFPTHPGS